MGNQQPCSPEYRHKGFGNHSNSRFPTAGRKQRPGSIDQFVSKQLLMRQQESQQAVQQFYAPIERSSPATLKSLYELPMKSREKGKDTILKADRTVFQRLITAYGAGRSADKQMEMQHELLPVPIALAEMNGQLRTGAKSILADVQCSYISDREATRGQNVWRSC